MNFLKSKLLMKTLPLLALVVLSYSTLRAQADEGTTVQTPEEIIRQVENDFFGVSQSFKSGSGCSGVITDLNRDELFAHRCLSSSFPETWRKFQNTAIKALIARLNKELNSWSTSELISKANLEKLIEIDLSKAMFTLDCSREYVTLYQKTVSFKLTRLGEILLHMTIPRGAGVEPSIVALGNALKSIKLIPSQKKVLKSFFEAAKRFYDSLQENTAKIAKGERPKAISHRDFMNQANLLIAYHRYLKEALDEAAQLSSDYYVTDGGNLAAVKCIEFSVLNLIEAYGLESDVTQRLVADYGRVLSDLLVNQLSPMVEENGKHTLIRPVIIQLAKMIAVSEANGDSVVQDETLRFKTLWENQNFSTLMGNMLTTTDLKMNGLILNINALAYKIGLATNIGIRVLEKDDIDRIRANKPRQK